MRINAIIAAAILAVTASGAALPQPEAQPEAVANAEPEAEPEAEADFEKRGLGFGGWRPYGLPIGKREAEAEAEAKLGSSDIST